MKEYIKDGFLYQGSIVLDNTLILNPCEEQILAAGYKEYVSNKKEENDDYEELVNKLIRQKYSLSQELSISRQRDVKKEEFEEFYKYCEECKKISRDIKQQDFYDENNI